MNNLQKCLASNMKLFRKKEGLSQAALAEKAGTAPNYIALIEVGKNFPSLQMLEKIANALNVDTLDLFDKQSLLLIDTNSLQEKLISSLTEVVKENIKLCSVIKNE
ncbi:putative transcriptional regulator [Treponema sp. JC4]|uniref:helix-turn-helix domain-containing protein n=1 Tax=Treponema sp. JC4 TaxID=1124982 RepID=UPI00025AFC07|nr:helix-turn-helix transcriptional regulator [Treponema sp. JC4]EID84861.1 putative transcriptional regulator [Treponema sp. JC4]